MSKIFKLVDDLNDKLDADETVSFSIDGNAYEIDLAKVNADKLRAALKEYVTAARRAPVASFARPRKNASTTRAGGRTDLDAIREWAKKQGHKVADRGRIAQSIQDEFDAAHAPGLSKPSVAVKNTATKTSAKEPANGVKEPLFTG